MSSLPRVLGAHRMTRRNWSPPALVVTYHGLAGVSLVGVSKSLRFHARHLHVHEEKRPRLPAHVEWNVGAAPHRPPERSAAAGREPPVVPLPLSLLCQLLARRPLPLRLPGPGDWGAQGLPAPARGVSNPRALAVGDVEGLRGPERGRCY